MGDPLLCCPPTRHLGCMLPVFVRLVVSLSAVLPPYTVHRINAACFGGMGVGVLSDSLLCYPPRTLHIGCVLSVFARLVECPSAVLPPQHCA